MSFVSTAVMTGFTTGIALQIVAGVIGDATGYSPDSSNTIGKFAQGIADDFLTSMYLATRVPVVIAPAMNSNMFAHPAVAANLAALQARGVRVVEPGAGYLACGWIGKGRLAEPEEIAETIAALASPAMAYVTGQVVVACGGRSLAP